MSAKEWGKGKGGVAHLIRLSDGDTCHASFSDFGARLVSLHLPDRRGEVLDVALGHDSLAEYENAQNQYTGATCGRYGNRIAGAAFSLDGKRFPLDANEGGNQLHGGKDGFHIRLWEIAELASDRVSFRLTSPEGDMGFPGRLEASVTYAFTAPMRFEIRHEARVTGQPTVVNLVHHSYFNLEGQGSGPIGAQELRINAEHYLPLGPGNIPSGALAPVKDTPFDFRKPRPMGAVTPPGGFDHNLCLSAGDAPQIEARDPASGRGFTLWTDQPGVQFYTGAHFAEGTRGKEGAVTGPHHGFALETQAWPDSPNQPDFPSTRLNPGEHYQHRMIFDFTPR